MTTRDGADPEDGIRRTFDPRDRTAADATRTAIRDALSADGVTKQDVANVELVFSELIGNALRYAGAEVDVRFAWERVLHVRQRTGISVRAASAVGHHVRKRSRLVSRHGTRRGLQRPAPPRRGSHARAVLRASRLPDRARAAPAHGSIDGARPEQVLRRHRCIEAIIGPDLERRVVP
ncbi:hypothetical protein WPS_18670 [Vulcanimicrobium alpinum]|uniref:Histidine kinase/HSP90-like ATPase domain-containing protein n=1 Tax=Vulcanimicrobium alpinum TaxID=3016050 RepID=A0AAN1XXU2_UNVUL|nr:hypothetical protein [Vulcanimicrobium alpinum]BDE06591.1 hypothetical protein WPS_18670 [Vulcanimicrobium alpinum]